MLITRRSDYALRICRVLQDKKIHNVTEICRTEEVPKAFAYKILREMEQKSFVRSERGNRGGYCLSVSLDDITLLDIVMELDDDVSMIHCVKEGCPRDTADAPCRMHEEIVRIQNILITEMQRKSIAEILG